MTQELERAGNPVNGCVLKADEGHSYGKVENRIDLYIQILAFLKDQFGQ